MRTKELQITNTSIAGKLLPGFLQVWVCVFFLCGTSLAQEKFTNSIVPSSLFADSAPIKILQLKHSERALKFGEDLINNDPLDLVSSLSISVVNTSNLAISDVDIDVQMPVSGGEIKHLVIPISLMRARDCSNAPNTEPLSPEGVITTRTRDRVSVKIPESLGKLGYQFGSGVIEIRIGTVKFVDGTAWRNGLYLERSDENLNVWRVLNLSDRSRLTGVDSESKEGKEKEPDSRSLSPQCWRYTGFIDRIPCEWSTNECPEGPYSCETIRDSADCCSEKGGVSPRTVLKSCRCIYSNESCDVYPITEYSGPCP